MSSRDEHLAGLLALPASDRARAARALLDSLDDEDGDSDAEQAQVAELVRRMQAFDSGSVHLVDADEARERVLSRLRSMRAR